MFCLHLTLTSFQDANKIQQYFSSDKAPTLWRVIPAVEDLISAWTKKAADPKYADYWPGLQAGIEKIKKYRPPLDKKKAYPLALSKFSASLDPDLPAFSLLPA